MTRRRFSTTLLVAFAVHALVLGLALRVRRGASASGSTPAATADVEIALLEEAPAPPAAEQPAASPRAAEPSAAVDVRRRSTVGQRVAVAEATNGTEGATTLDTSSAADAGAWAFSPTREGANDPATVVKLAPDGTLALRIAAAGQDLKRPKRTGGVTEALESHATELGLGAGEVLRAAEAATRRAVLSNESSATWEVDADAAGRVTRVRVMSASADRSIWETLVESALNGVVVSAPKGPNGVVIRFQVDVADKLPSGAKTAISDVKTGPMPFGWGVTGKFDVADVGAHLRRVVAAHVLAIEPK